MKTAVVILAAGRGERMKSLLPKVLHRISDKPMLQRVIDSASMLQPSKIVIVAGKNYKVIKEAVSGNNISFVIQKEPKGTGDALSRAVSVLKNFGGTILVLNGDVPLIKTETLNKFLRLHNKNKNSLSFISFVASEPSAYGRVVRNYSGDIISIVEEKDATREQKNIREVNSGVYAFSPYALGLLRYIKLNALKGEYYLTDIIRIAKSKGWKADAYCLSSDDEMMGINTMSELIKANKLFRKQLVNKWLERGVMFMDPDSVFISPEAELGKETVIYPNVYLEGKTKIGRKCVIHPNVHITDSVIMDNAIIKNSTVIENSIIRRGAVAGPFAHVRPGCDIGSGAKIGNFVELKKSVIGDGTKASHLSYIGDADVGRDVNIGAGTITCNYDGREKHKTKIEDGVFIGSDTQLIAPVTVGRGAYVGAGSTITKNVPPKSLAVSRTEQKNVEGWAKKRAEVRSSKLKKKGKEKK